MNPTVMIMCFFQDFFLFINDRFKRPVYRTKVVKAYGGLEVLLHLLKRGTR